MTVLSPLDLLTLSANEQDIVRCLIRKPDLSSLQISQLTRIPTKECEAVIKQLVQDARLMERWSGDEKSYYVSMRQSQPARQKKPQSSLLEGLFG